MRDHQIEWELDRDEGAVPITVRYDIEPYVPGRLSGPPEDCYPPEGGCVTDLEAFRPGTEEVIELTAEERKRVIDWIEQNHDHDADNQPDPDEAYDRMRDDELTIHRLDTSWWDD